MEQVMTELKTLKFTILGNPTPLARPRFSDGKCWDSQRMKKRVSSGQLSRQHFNRPMIEAPISMQLKFYFEFTSSFSKKAREAGAVLRATKPDLDNLIKYVCDVGNDIIWRDDAQIYHIEASKHFDHIGRTEIIITF